MAMPLSPVSQITAAPATPDKQSTAGTPDMTFNHVLTHEMTQQQDAKASASSTNPPATPIAPTDKSKKAADPSQAADAATSAATSAAALQTALPPISAELLAMMGNYSAAHAALPAPPATATVTTKLPSTTTAANTATATSTPAAPKYQNDLLSALPALATPANNASADVTPPLAAPQSEVKFADSIKTATLVSTDTGTIPAQKNTNLLPLPLTVPTMVNPLSNPILMANLAQNAAPQSVSGLSPQVGTSAWNHALGEKIVWMVGGAEQTASLSLNPPDLGPLQIVLNVTNNQANATFIAAQPEVRLAIEAALPRLHEMMNNAGIQLGQTNVRSDTSSQQDRQSDSRAFRPLNATRAVGTDQAINISGKIITGQGLVNTFV
ncbi:MAG: flagellar hook-length control protein FliK [Sulfuriferula sp.]